MGFVFENQPPNLDEREEDRLYPQDKELSPDEAGKMLDSVAKGDWEPNWDSTIRVMNSPTKELWRRLPDEVKEVWMKNRHETLITLWDTALAGKEEDIYAFWKYFNDHLPRNLKGALEFRQGLLAEITTAFFFNNLDYEVYLAENKEDLGGVDLWIRKPDGQPVAIDAKGRIDIVKPQLEPNGQIQTCPAWKLYVPSYRHDFLYRRPISGVPNQTLNEEFANEIGRCRFP